MPSTYSWNGTQGAATVVPGRQDQRLGDLRLVVPMTYAKGDYIDLVVASQAANAATDVRQRVSISRPPAVSVEGPYSAALRVAPTSTSTADNTTEGYREPYTDEAGDGRQPARPTIGLVNTSTGTTTIRLTFPDDAPSPTAKEVLTVSGLLVDVGSDVPTGNITVTGDAFHADGSPIHAFFGTPSGAEANVTIPGYLPDATISSDSSDLSAYEPGQDVGDVTVRRREGTFTDGDYVGFWVSGADLSTASTLTATLYDDAHGTSTAVDVHVYPIQYLEIDIPAGSTANRVVVHGMHVDASYGQQLQLALDEAGGAEVAPYRLVGAKVNQTDLTPPPGAELTGPQIVFAFHRLGGSDRYETAAKIADAEYRPGYPDSGPEANDVVLASGENFPDALSAAYLAATKQAPVLLTPRGHLPDIDAEFMREHGTKNVYIVGGTSAVGTGIETALAATQAYDLDGSGAAQSPRPTRGTIQVTRLAGTTRYDTNRAVNEYAVSQRETGVGTTVARYGQPSRPTALIASGEAPWDALAAGPLAGGPISANGDTSARQPIPLILTPTAGLGADARQQLTDLGIQRTLLVGGEAALGPQIPHSLAATGVTSTRLGGDNRYATAAAIDDFAQKSALVDADHPRPGFGFIHKASTTYLVNAGDPDPGAWADALAAGAPSHRRTPVLVTPTAADHLPAESATFLARQRNTLITATAVGLGDVIETSVAKEAARILSQQH